MSIQIELGRSKMFTLIAFWRLLTWTMICLHFMDWLHNVPWLQVGEQGPGPGYGDQGGAARLLLLPPGRWRDPRPLQHLPAWLPNVRILFPVQRAQTQRWLNVYVIYLEVHLNQSGYRVFMIYLWILWQSANCASNSWNDIKSMMSSNWLYNLFYSRSQVIKCSMFSSFI